MLQTGIEPTLKGHQRLSLILGWFEAAVCTFVLAARKLTQSGSIE